MPDNDAFEKLFRAAQLKIKINLGFLGANFLTLKNLPKPCRKRKGFKGKGKPRLG